MDPSEPIRTKYIKVTNHMDVTFNDRHDGVPVFIAPGKSENLPLDMAEHFFGYNDAVPADKLHEAMYRHTAKRQGWNTITHMARDDTGKTLAERRFAALEIVPVVYRLVEERIDTTQPIPADQGPEDLPALPDLSAGGRSTKWPPRRQQPPPEA